MASVSCIPVGAFPECKMSHRLGIATLYIPMQQMAKISLFHCRTRASYVYNGYLAWYNVVLTHGSTQA